MPFAASRRTSALFARAVALSRARPSYYKRKAPRGNSIYRAGPNKRLGEGRDGARLKLNGAPVCLFRGSGLGLLPKRPLRAMAVLWPLGRDGDLRLSNAGWGTRAIPRHPRTIARQPEQRAECGVVNVTADTQTKKTCSTAILSILRPARRSP